MKKTIFLATLILLISGCSYKAEYNANAEIAQIDESISVSSPLQSSVIYVPSSLMGTQKYEASTKLGNDESLKLDVGEFAKNGSQRFFSNYLTGVKTSSSDDVLGSSGLVIVPEITAFRYGFYSADGFEVTARPYVSYDFRLKIFKRGKLIYNKNISTNEKNFGESAFYGGGGGHHAQIGGIFQKAIANDYNVHAREIMDTINLAD